MFSNLLFASAMAFAALGSYLAIKKKPSGFSALMAAFAIVALPELNARVSAAISPTAGDIAMGVAMLAAILIAAAVEWPPKPVNQSNQKLTS